MDGHVQATHQYCLARGLTELATYRREMNWNALTGGETDTRLAAMFFPGGTDERAPQTNTVTPGRGYPRRMLGSTTVLYNQQLHGQAMDYQRDEHRVHLMSNWQFNLITFTSLCAYDRACRLPTW